MRKVKLTYFKESGKYYTEGEYESNGLDYEIYAEIRDGNITATAFNPMPGLVSKWEEGYILVEPENGVPALMVVHDSNKQRMFS